MGKDFGNIGRVDMPMMKHRVIPLEDFPRRKHFAFFSAMQNPYVGVTMEVDITDFLSACHERSVPFFLSFVYCVGRAANAVPQLRQRIWNGCIIEFEQCDASHTVLCPDETYGYCRLDCMRPFEDYLPEAISLHRQAKENPCMEDGEDGINLLFLSSIPWLHYAALTQPLPSPADSNPRITWGQYVEQNGRVTLPVTLLANHALVDGLHLAAFYRSLDRELKAWTEKPQA